MRLEDHHRRGARLFSFAARCNRRQRIALQSRRGSASSLTAIQWVTSGYLLALALMLPLNGWMVERIGAKSLYLWCFSTFTLASALCGLAWSANSLIAFRILQGMSGGLMAPMAQMMMARAAGKHMARVIGYAAVPVMLGPILGPVIAGAILQYASWRWLFLVKLPVGALAIVLAVLYSSQGSRRDPVKGTRSSRLCPALPGLVLFLYGSDHLGERIGLVALLIFIVLLAAFYRMAIRKRGQGAHRSSAIQEKNLLCVRHHPVHDKRNLLRRPDADSHLPHPRLQPITQCDGLVAGFAWSGNDLYLSMDGSPDAAVRDTKGIGWRRISGLRSHPAIHLAGQSRTCTHRPHRCSLCAWDGPQRGRHSLHLGRLRLCQKTGPSHGDNLAQYCAASRRPDSHYPLRNLSGMEVGDGTVQRWPLRRIYRGLCSSLRLQALLFVAALRLPFSIDKAMKQPVAEEPSALLELMSE